MKNKKLHILNAAAKERAALIEDWQTGNFKYAELARKYKIHWTTAKKWIEYYEEEGLAGLKRDRKPRPKHDIELDDLKAFVHAATEAGKNKKAHRATILIELEETEIQLKQVAARERISVQAILKWRRAWVGGKWKV